MFLLFATLSCRIGVQISVTLSIICWQEVDSGPGSSSGSNIQEYMEDEQVCQFETCHFHYVLPPTSPLCPLPYPLPTPKRNHNKTRTKNTTNCPDLSRTNTCVYCLHLQLFASIAAVHDSVWMVNKIQK